MFVFVRRFLSAAVEARWWVLGVLGAAHVAVSWVVLALLGERGLTDGAFGYWYLTTVTTVGYGDLSPGSAAGRWFTALFVMIGGIALFTAVLGKAIGSVSGAWRRRMDGYGDYTKLEGATVIVGHEPGRTGRLIAELQADDGQAGGVDEAPIVVVSTEPAPLPDGVRLVRTDRLTDGDALRRAGIKGAGRIVVFAEDDDVTLGACLAALALNETAHAVAYFTDPDTAALARHHCPRLETVSSPAENLVVHATRDPGAAAVLTALVTAGESGTIWSAKGAGLGAPLTVSALADRLRGERATLLAVAPPDAPPELCLRGDTDIGVGDTVFYVARKRVA